MPFRTIKGKSIWIRPVELKEIRKNGFAFISGNTNDYKKKMRIDAKKRGMKWHESENVHISLNDLPDVFPNMTKTQMFYFKKRVRAS